MNPMEWFESDEMDEARDIFLNHDDPSKHPKIKNLCRTCWKAEDKGIESRRIRLLHRVDLDAIKDNYKRNGKYKIDSRVLDLKLRIFGNQCNLSCVMCSQRNSSRRITDITKMKGIYDSPWTSNNAIKYDGQKIMDFQKNDRKDALSNMITYDIPKMAKYIDRFMIIGGEPMIMPDHYKVLDALIESGESHNITLDYLSNVTKFTNNNNNFFNYLDKFKNVTVAASIDGVDQYSDYIRQHSNWDDIANNLLLLKSDKNVRLSIVTTLSALSVLRITELLDYLLDELYMDINRIDFTSNVVTSPSFLSVSHLPDELKTKLVYKLENHKHSNLFASFINLLKHPGDPVETQNLYQYLNDIDEFYDISYKETWPELVPSGLENIVLL
jgi:sulfatase maturation enzyme AslB (radical SAM superfamily)